MTVRMTLQAHARAIFDEATRGGNDPVTICDHAAIILDLMRFRPMTQPPATDGIYLVERQDNSTEVMYFQRRRGWDDSIGSAGNPVTGWRVFQ